MTIARHGACLWAKGTFGVPGPQAPRRANLELINQGGDIIAEQKRGDILPGQQQAPQRWLFFSYGKSQRRYRSR